MSAEYPKWVTPHASHITRLLDGRPIVQLWPFHVDRDGDIKVIVQDADDEARVIADKNPPAVIEETEHDVH